MTAVNWLAAALVALVVGLEVMRRHRAMPWYDRLRAPLVGLAASAVVLALFLLGRGKPEEKPDPPQFDDSDHRETDAKADDTDLSSAADARVADALDDRSDDRDAKLESLRARAERLRRGEVDSS